MATEEIEISGLEFTEELASDNLIPVESTSNTKATSLQVVKNWLLSFFVSKTANERIEGEKTFYSSGSGGKIIQRTDSKVEGCYIDFIQAIDKSRKGTIRTTYNSDGSYSTLLASNGPNSLAPEGIVVTRYEDGRIFTQAKTPTAESNNVDIATTQWVRENVATIRKATNGYNKFINGLIIQWGYIPLDEKTGTITFPTPFTDSNYCVVLEPFWDSTGATSSTLGHTTTSFNYKRSRSDVSYRWMAVGY